MNTAIAIFVKTPEHSPVKTRLAADIGKDKAEEFYLLSLKAVASTVRSTNLTPYWAVGEEEGLNNSLWSNFNRIYTGLGNLGDRQHHVYSELLDKYDRVLLIGGDAPQISQAIINDAVSELDDHDFVIGAARDGGYYLFGGSKGLRKDIWKSIPWSASITRARLIDALPSKPYELSLLSDVDIRRDLLQALNEMPDILNIDQENMIKWIKVNH